MKSCKIKLPLKALKDAKALERQLREDLEIAVEKQIELEREKFWDLIMNGDGEGINVKGLEGYL